MVFTQSPFGDIFGVDLTTSSLLYNQNQIQTIFASVATMSQKPSAARPNVRNCRLPEWNIPPDLRALVDADNDSAWNCDDWSPIVLSVSRNTQHDERDINLAWQIEYETTGCTGYEFCDRVMVAVKASDPSLAALLNCGDTESAACVIWVETEDACRRLLEIVWPMVA